MENPSEETIFDPIKLEKLLIKDWTSFIDARNLLNFLKSNVKNQLNISNPKIQTLMVSNCELKPKGISLWINYNIVNSNSCVNVTNEILFDYSGEAKITNTI